eukprot:10788957-Ditylum_brightwellii.AAC.1
MATFIAFPMTYDGLGVPSVNPGDPTRSPHAGIPSPIPVVCLPSKLMWLANLTREIQLKSTL